MADKIIRSVTVYFDEQRKSGVHVTAPEDLPKDQLDGVEKKLACGIGFKDPDVNRGNVILFLLDPTEARALGEKLLLFAAESKL